MARAHHEEGTVEQVPIGNSPPPVSRRHFHSMHAPDQKEAAIERVPLPGEAPPPSTSAAPNSAELEQFARSLEDVFARIDQRLGELAAAHAETDARLLLIEQRLEATAHVGELARRLQSAEDKLGNVLERLEALESLEKAAHDASSSGKSGKK